MKNVRQAHLELSLDWNQTKQTITVTLANAAYSIYKTYQIVTQGITLRYVIFFFQGDQNAFLLCYCRLKAILDIIAGGVLTRNVTAFLRLGEQVQLVKQFRQFVMSPSSVKHLPK